MEIYRDTKPPLKLATRPQPFHAGQEPTDAQIAQNALTVRNCTNTRAWVWNGCVIYEVDDPNRAPIVHWALEED